MNSLHYVVVLQYIEAEEILCIGVLVLSVLPTLPYIPYYVT